MVYHQLLFAPIPAPKRSRTYLEIEFGEQNRPKRSQIRHKMTFIIPVRGFFDPLCYIITGKVRPNCLAFPRSQPCRAF